MYNFMIMRRARAPERPVKGSTAKGNHLLDGKGEGHVQSLGNDRDTARDLATPPLRECAPFQLYLSLLRAQCATQESQQGRFARSVRSEQS